MENRNGTIVRRLVASSLIGSMLLLSNACSYHRAYIDYADYTGDVRLQVPPWAGQRLGPIRAKEGGAIWDDCTSVARGSIWVLITETKKLGGNAIGEIRWFPEKPKEVRGNPTCRRKWGWFLVWPVLLTPLFMRATVEAYAFEVDPKQPRADLYVIPDSHAGQAALVERILAETAPFGRQPDDDEAGTGQ